MYGSALHSVKVPTWLVILISSLYQKLGISQIRTTVYHPQGNIQVEKFNVGDAT